MKFCNLNLINAIFYSIVINLTYVKRKENDRPDNIPNQFIGKRIYYYKKIKSTQQLAISLADINPTDENGTVILAEEQFDGHGRGTKKWISPKGGLWMSIIIKPKIEVSRLSIFSLIASISLCEAINEIGNVKCRIKWPNDILINEKKVAGIIIDSTINYYHNDYVIIGIGINVETDIVKLNLSISSNDKHAQKATSIRNELKGNKIDQFHLFKNILENLEHYISLTENYNSNREIVGIYKRLCSTIGKNIYIYEGAKGYHAFAKDIDTYGGLVIHGPDNDTKTIYSGEVSVR